MIGAEVSPPRLWRRARPRRDEVRGSSVARRAGWRITLGAIVLFTLIVTRGRPWRFFERGDFSSDFYDAQARAFVHGKLAVPADIASIEGFVNDGGTYLYYGPFLAIVRLPTAMFGSWIDGRLTRLSMVIALVALCRITAMLPDRVARLTDGGLDAGVSRTRRAVLVAAVACSPVLALAGGASVYHETEIWALVLMLATCVAALDLLYLPTTTGAIGAGILASATILTRVSVGLGAATMVAAAACLLWRRDRRRAIVALVPVATGTALHVALNLAKFGTLMDLPWDRQVLTQLDPGRAEWFAGNGGSFFGVHFVPTTLTQYLRPDAIAVERLAPFVRFGGRAHEFGSYPLESNTPSSSLTAAATLLVIAASIGAVLAMTRSLIALVPLVAGAVVAAGPTLAIGFVANRYLVDLLPGLVVLGAVGVTHFRPRRRAVAVSAVAVLAVLGAWVNASLAIWMQGIQRPAFTAARYEIDARLFGGTPPSVVDLRPDGPLPRDGTVGIDGPCNGLYVSSGDIWVALEVADGIRHVRGVLDPNVDPVVLAGAGASRLALIPGPGTLMASFDPGSAPPLLGSPIAWDGGPVTVDVRSDPIPGGLGRGLLVTVDGDVALADWIAPDLSAYEPGRAIEVLSTDDRGVGTCERLMQRRD